MNNKLLQFITKNTPGGGTKKSSHYLYLIFIAVEPIQ